MCSFRRAVSQSSNPASHASRSIGEGQRGAGGIWKFLIIRESVSESESHHRGVLGHGIRVGGARFIVIGTGFDLVEGRETSQPFTIGRRRGLAKDRSITEGQAFAPKGNLVYSQGGLRRTRPASAAFSKDGDKEPISRGDNHRSGAQRGLCMLRSATMRRETPRVRRGFLGRLSGPDGHAC